MVEIGAGLEAIRGWITTGGIMGLLILASRLWVINRKLRMAEKADDREGYGVLIGALQKDIEIVRGHHRDCEKRLAQVEAELTGVHRQIIMLSGREAVSIPPSANVQRAAEASRRHAAGEDG